VRIAVVGHLEWCDFLPVGRLPRPGEILETTDDFAEPAGGGAVTAVQIARLGADCTFSTAIGDDENGDRVGPRLTELGVRVHAVRRTGAPTRRAFVYLDAEHERTITTIGERIHPRRGDDLPWHELEDADAVYFAAGDADALRAARSARVLVATARISEVLENADVPLDAVVGSSHDTAERHRPIDPPPKLVVSTAGAKGGTWTAAEGLHGEWAAAELPGERADAYGAGDSFAGGLTFALGRGDPVNVALELASRCGATCMTSRGPYERQLSKRDL
jgi:ribokinase